MRHTCSAVKGNKLWKKGCGFRIPLSKCYFMSKWTNWGRDKSNINTEALVLSVDRVLNFFSVENSLFQEYFLLFFVYFPQMDFWKSKSNVPLPGSS